MIKKDELLWGSIILLFMIALFNLLNYAFQISMAKMLGPENFSIVAVLMSIIYIFNIPAETIQTVVSKYTSKFNGESSDDKIKDLIIKSLRKGTVLAAEIFILFLPISIILSKILRIEYTLLALTGISIFYVFTIPVFRGVLQGKKRFFLMGSSMVIESLFKVVIAISLVFIGWEVYGAIGGVLIAGLMTMLVLIIALRKILKINKENYDFKGIYSQNMPTLIALVSIVLIYSLDVILARTLFDSRLAGQYSFVSLLGKVILFMGLAISKVMFPLSAESYERKKKTKGIFLKSFTIILAGSLALCMIYLLIPETVIKIVSLGSEEYLEASSVLFILGLSYTFLSIVNLIYLYKISINDLKKRESYFICLFVLLQLILMTLFSKTLIEFSMAFLFVSTIMFLYSLFLFKK